MSGLGDAVGPMLAGVLLIGALIGAALVGVGFGVYYLWCHIDIVWIP